MALDNLESQTQFPDELKPRHVTVSSPTKKSEEMKVMVSLKSGNKKNVGSKRPKKRKKNGS